jgi:dolichol-phosphate mannosyltransferase
MGHPPLMSLLVVTPTYREAGNLPEFLERTWAAVPAAHILVVDDASGDGTPEWLGRQAGYGERLFLIARPGKLGLGTAYLAGFRWALERAYAHTVQIDADLSHNPSDIPRLLDRLRQGAALAVATRYRDGVRVLNWPAGRLALSLAAAAFVRAVTGLPSTDPTGGFKAWSGPALAQFDFDRIESNGYAFQIEMTYTAWRLGLRIDEVPIIFEGRHAGESKMSPAIAREAFWTVLRLSWQRKLPVRSLPA